METLVFQAEGSSTKGIDKDKTLFTFILRNEAFPLIPSK